VKKPAWLDGDDVRDTLDRVVAWQILFKNPFNRYAWGWYAWKKRAEVFAWLFTTLFGAVFAASLLSHVVEKLLDKAIGW
jgi:hypothetical protein